MMDFDLIVNGGLIVDGTGKPAYPADIAIQDGRIALIDSIETPNGIPVLDANGLIVAPGFIDIHSHSDFTLVVDPRAMSQITQGVTLEVIGNCGHGCAPIVDPVLARSVIYGSSVDHGIPWRTMAEYLEHLEAGQPAVNVMTLVPNGLLRLAVVDDIARPSTPDEIRQMKKLLTQSLEEGAFGLSTGLEYGPELPCPETEIIELCRVVAEKGGFYATHTRNREGEVDETIAEAIRTAAAADVRLQISHIQVVARLTDNGRWAYERALQLVDTAKQQGQDIGFDMHTRLFGTTHLSTALPTSALEGDKTSIAQRLQDPGLRKKLKSYKGLLYNLVRGDWNQIVLLNCNSRPDLTGKTITEIGRLQGTDPLDTIYDLLLAEIDDIHGPMIKALTYRAEENQIAFEHPHCMIGSDATALATDGPLKNSTFHGAYTWASWYYRHFVRDTQTLSTEEAVRRLTSLPANQLGLTDRGTIRQGACADLAIFDPATFTECGTVEEPNQTAIGMVHVLVNGEITLKNGKLTGNHGGQVLRSSAQGLKIQ